MLIQCTKMLLDQLRLKSKELVPTEGYDQYPNSFIAWHANLIQIGRKKAIVLMNNETRYPILIYGLVKKDFTNLKVLIRKAITEVLSLEGVSKEIIEDYFTKAGEIQFTKTGSRSILSKLNNTVLEIETFDEYLNKEAKTQKYMSFAASRLIQTAPNKKDYFYPNEKMLKCLSLYCLNSENAEEILDITLYQLLIKINLDGQDIWRRVLVPSTCSFRQLHNVIQTVFDWQNSHLHEFTVERKDEKPLKIVMDDSPEIIELINEERFDICQELFVSLKDIFPKYNSVKYIYDFGDYWEHSITLEGMEKINQCRAVYVDGNGERPPEDVGGNGGFEEYLKIMSDPKDPEHEYMKEWAESQRERTFMKEIINERLKDAISSYRFSFDKYSGY